MKLDRINIFILFFFTFNHVRKYFRNFLTNKLSVINKTKYIFGLYECTTKQYAISYYEFQGDETYIYNYDSLGRVTDVILPTGEKLKLSSDLSDDESLSVKVSAPLQALSKGDKQRSIEFKMKNEKSKMLTITDGMYFFKLFKY